MFGMAKKPGFPNGCTANHNSVHSIAIKGLFGFYGRRNIPIPYDGDFHSWIVPDLPDECPVGRSFVHLGPCPSMDGEGTDPQVLKLFSHFNYDLT